MKLSIAELNEVPDGGVRKPNPASLNLPEKVLQFGTGVLLRGLPDYFIDQANQHGIFNGRIVIVKSTSGGDGAAFQRQDNLYTLCVRGLEHGHKVKDNLISSAISRVLTATEHWNEVLELARAQNIRIIISNTTEVGIQLVEESIHDTPPSSYPAKLLAFLYARYQACNGSMEGGLVIIPTELISDNATKLRGICLELTRHNQLGDDFETWMITANQWCNSLVDRIVPGRPDAATLDQIQKYLGYEDDLLLICEAYRLWAIEGSKELLSPILSFAQADSGVIIAANIEEFKELKLRMLNGTHTIACGLAFLSGFDTVRDTMENEEFADFIQTVMMDEIAHAIPAHLPDGAAHQFGHKVLDRFRNPYLDHRWINITLQYSSKLKLRVIPVLLRHYAQKDSVPEAMAMGFAGHILFMRSRKVEDGKYFGESRGIHYPINDDNAGIYHDYWKQGDPALVVKSILQDQNLWGEDLTTLKGFEKTVHDQLISLREKGGIS
jgi:tagaturonate reductase